VPFEVGSPCFLVQGVEVVGRRVLPARVGCERTFGPRGVQQRAHDALGAADHVAERGHPAMDHRRPARTQAELLQIVSEPQTGH
jgi:hypothetical protein